MKRALLLLLLATGCGGDPAGGDGTSTPIGWLTAQTLFDDGAARAERVSYTAERGPAVGLLCRPLSSGRHPVVVINHGGWQGVGAEWNVAGSACLALARAGYVVMEASYRGEDGSAGAIEVCLGEADDVARMLAVVAAQPYADARVLVLGGSHGGCVTVRMLQNGVRVARAVALNAPADMADLYANAETQIAAGATGARLTFFQSLITLMQSLYGGRPQERAAEYARHSTLQEAARVGASPVPLLLQHGVQDDVVPVAHSCRLAEAAGGFEAYHVGADGNVIAAPPPTCAGLGLTWRPGPVPGDWPARHYLVVYEGLDHAATGASAARAELHMQQFLTLP